MRVLEKIRLLDATELNHREMKVVYGGSGGNTGCNGLRAGDSCTTAHYGLSGICERHFGILVCTARDI